MNGPSGAAHLVRRFVSSLSRRPPAPDDERWLVALLTPSEATLYRSLSTPDRRHALDSARRAEALLAASGAETGGRPGPVLLVAAALHDVGKTPARLGTLGRVVATVVGALRLPARGRLATYLGHPELGAELLAAAGSAPLVVTWAREHHQPAGASSLPTATQRVLAAAD